MKSDRELRMAFAIKGLFFNERRFEDVPFERSPTAIIKWKIEHFLLRDLHVVESLIPLVGAAFS